MRRGHRGPRSEEGVAMLGILLTVIILGVMVVIMFNTLGGTPTGSGTTSTIPGSTATPGTTSTAPATPENGAQAAAVTACQANYQAIETALTDYRSLNGSSPAAGAMGNVNGEWRTLSAGLARNGDLLLIWNGAQLSVMFVRGAPSLVGRHQYSQDRLLRGVIFLTSTAARESVSNQSLTRSRQVEAVRNHHRARTVRDCRHSFAASSHRHRQ